MLRGPWDQACCLLHFYKRILVSIRSTTVRKTYACANEIPGVHQQQKNNNNKATENKQTKQKPEPVSNTSRRDARATYHDDYNRDFGPQSLIPSVLHPNQSVSQFVLTPDQIRKKVNAKQSNLNSILYTHGIF